VAILGALYIGNAEAAETTTWKVQAAWPGGIGLDIFKSWCDSVVEKTGGELAFQPFGAAPFVGFYVANGDQEFVNQTIIGTGLGPYGILVLIMVILFLQAVGLSICVIFPEVVLWLPRQVYGV
jgi:hypothetical protein